MAGSSGKDQAQHCRHGSLGRLKSGEFGGHSSLLINSGQLIAIYYRISRVV